LRDRAEGAKHAAWGTLLFMLVAGVGVLGTSCHDGPTVADDISVSWSAMPERPVVGQLVVAEVTLRDGDARPVRGAHLECRGFMSHPGMAPITGAAAERADGVYEVRLQFTMAGDWIVLVTGSLPDGRTLNSRIDIANVQPPE